MDKDPLAQAVEVVEAVLREQLGLDPNTLRVKTGDGSLCWGLMKGSAEVFIVIRPKADQSGHVIRVTAPVIEVPADDASRLDLFERLLRDNAENLTAAAFGLRDDTILLTADRSIDDLDASEVREMLLRVGFYADLYDDALAAHYGTRRYTDPGA